MLSFSIPFEVRHNILQFDVKGNGGPGYGLLKGVAPYDAILLDFDGTLVDSEPIHYACWLEVLAPFGVNFTWEEYERNCIGVSDRAMIEKLAGSLGVPFEELYATYPAKKALLRERTVANPPMPTAVREILPKLPLPLGLVTSSHKLEVAPVLEALQLMQLFRGAVYGDEVGNLKPHPEPYLTAAARLNVQKPIVFEDSQAGLASARAAGFTAVHVAHPNELPALLALHLEL